MGRLFAIGFLVLPLVEIALFIIVGRTIGVLPTLGLVLLGVVGGAMVLRQQGLSVIARMRSSMGAGTIPGQAMFDTMLIGLAGLLLMMPGFLTDIVALALLLPPVRSAIFASLAKRFKVVETTTSYRRYEDPADPRLTRPSVIDLDDEDWRGRQ